MAEECLFCKIVRGEIPTAKVLETESLLAFEDIRPQAPVHVLIVPKAHIPTVADLQAGQAEVAGNLVLAANRIAAEKKLEQGYRLVFNCRQAAGQEVYHLHLHLLGGRKLAWPPG